MHRDANFSIPLHRHRIAALFRCPSCKEPHVMNIKAIRPAIFRGRDLIIYECAHCGEQKTEIMA